MGIGFGLSSRNWWRAQGGGGYTPPQLLLDEYPNAAAAYSLRELSTAFVGQSVVRVRRSSDNTEQDFTATEITDGTLTTFTGANDGFVTTWYDQSGNGKNLSTATATEQPKIVSNGVLNLDNGKPYLQYLDNFAGLSGLNVSLVGLDFNNSSLFATYNSNSNSNGCLLGTINSGSTYVGLYDEGSSATPNSDAGNPNYYSNSIILSSATRDSLYNNLVTNQDVLVSVLNIDFSETTEWDTGGITPYMYRTNNFTAPSKAKEMIIYNSDQSANRTGIETNINNEYSIYEVPDFTTNLVASYSFDTDFSDYTGNNNLTASGDATAGVTGGKVNGCLEVDGVDDYSIAVDSNDFSFTNGSNDLPFSISIWANGDNLGTGNLVNKRIYFGDYEYQIFILSSQIVVNLFSQGGSANQLKTRVFGTYNNNTWYNIAVTYDGSGNNSGLKIYVNGVLPTQTLDPVGTYVGMSNTTSPFTIGSFENGVDDFDGKIDEVHVWKNRELTSAEVLDIYNTENAGNSILP